MRSGSKWKVPAVMAQGTPMDGEHTVVAEAPTSESDRAYQLMRAAVIAGTFPPGERLRPAAIQERFGVGLTPIREALMRLGVEGLVVGEPQRGFRVRDASLAEFNDLMETRRELERICLTRSITRGNETWESAIVAAMHLLSRTPLPSTRSDARTADLWEQRHRNFHLALVSACDSSWRLHFWNVLADHSERYRKLRLLRRGERVAQVRDLDAEHQRIMEAVLARNEALACRLMDQHLLATQQAIVRMLAERDSRGAGRVRSIARAGAGPRA